MCFCEGCPVVFDKNFNVIGITKMIDDLGVRNGAAELAQLTTAE